MLIEIESAGGKSQSMHALCHHLQLGLVRDAVMMIVLTGVLLVNLPRLATRGCNRPSFLSQGGALR